MATFDRLCKWLCLAFLAFAGGGVLAMWLNPAPIPVETAYTTQQAHLLGVLSANAVNESSRRKAHAMTQAQRNQAIAYLYGEDK